MFTTNMISQDAFLFKVGWKDWVLFAKCRGELGLGESEPSPQSAQFVERAPRATIEGQVIIHNNGDLIIGKGVNISATGIFIETTSVAFKVGEVLNVTCLVKGVLKPFNAKALVMRFNSEAGGPKGYGLRFEILDVKVAREIAMLVEKSNEENFKK